MAVFHSADGKLKTAERTEMVTVLHVSADFFNVLGIKPAQGRDLTSEDDHPGATRVTWLTDDAWRRLFDGDPNLVGRTFSLDGQNLTIAGILPSDFRFYRDTDLVTAIAPFAKQFFLDMRPNHSNTEGVGRLKPGVTLAAARANMEAIATRLAMEYAEFNGEIGVEVQSLRERLGGAARPQLLLLLGAVGVVLLIACVNVANMLLSRSSSREREMAIRTSLGASRPILLRQLLVESLVLATLGGLVGLLIGVWGYRLGSRLIPYQVQQVVEAEAPFDFSVALFVLAVTVVTGIVFGLMPAWQLSQIRPAAALKEATSLPRGMLGRLRLSDLLVVAQVALALVLLISAGLMIRSLQQLVEVETGFDASRVLTLQVTAPPVEQFLRDPFSFARHYQRVLEPVEALPEVEAAAVVSGLPFTAYTSTTVFYRTDRPIPDSGRYPSASTHTVSPGYFQAMGIPLLRGRTFDGTEPPYELPPEMEISPANLGTIFLDVTIAGVISQKMADRFWPGEDPIGKRFRIGFAEMQMPAVEVIGIVGNTVQYGLDQGETTEFYLPLNQWPVPTPLHLVVRTRLNPASAVNSVSAAIESVLPDEPIRDVRVLAGRIEESTSGRRFNRNLFALFAAAALVLAILGVYGVLAFNVSRRVREIGIRVAVGAQRLDVIRSVLVRGLVLVVPGLAIGIAGAYAVARLLQSQLYAIGSADPLTYAGGAVLLFTTALAATLGPARRAARVDPMEALRTE
jgi:putative ABC transport system permease protein